MIEANKAYALGDEEQLRAILEAWERGPDAVQGTDREAMRLRLVRRIAQIEDQLEVLAGDLAAIEGIVVVEVEGDGRRRGSQGQRPGSRHGQAAQSRHPGRHQSPGCADALRAQGVGTIIPLIGKSPLGCNP